ncbi:MAG: hypothetical protein KIT09_20585 [Bryobacteraceae bacterium]|nr:hypothetical protein [Bryobacteraceae bacterium]
MTRFPSGDERRRQALACIVTLLAALGLVWISPRVASTGWEWTWELQKLVRHARSRVLNWQAEGTGYYEQLLDASTGVPGARAGAFLDALRRREEQAEPEIVDRRGKFLVYELKPNLDVQHSREGPLVTNEHGMADGPYALNKPAGTRRIALFGDSVSRSMGVPVGRNYEALLEERLNAERAGGRYQRFEILNFSTSGYRVTQFAGVASEKARRFDPDVYMLALTDLVFRGWSEHLWSLIHHGIDLEYETLRGIVRRSGAAVELGYRESIRRLQPYRLEVNRWALEHVRETASSGASVVVLLVPTADERDVLERRFFSTKRLLKEFDFPVVELLDTFERVPDLEALRLASWDNHPNTRGHIILFENLYRKLRADPDAWRSVVGEDAN